MRKNIQITLIVAMIMVSVIPHAMGEKCERTMSATTMMADTGTRRPPGADSPQMGYMYMQERMDGTCHAVYDSILRIHYEEPYAVSNTQRLRFKVYDKYRNTVVQTDNAGNITDSVCQTMNPSPVITTGENWLTVSLRCLNLTEGEYYYLEVWNGKGEKGYLRFKVVP